MRMQTVGHRQPQPYYDVAQVCLNGHVITDRFNDRPVHRKEFCSTCGARTIADCPGCKRPIQGHYVVPGSSSLSIGPLFPPNCCAGCGQSFPWHASGLDAAKQLAREADEITEEDRASLAEAIDDVAVDTPRTQLAVERIKRFLVKLKPGTGQAMSDMLKDIATDYAKRLLGLS